MADPLGTIGIAPRPPSTDLDLAADGGPVFMDRLRLLGEAKDAAARALRELKLGEKAADAFKRADQMKKAAEDALVNAGQDVFDAARKAEEARALAKAIIADANKRSADAEARLATVERAEQDVMKERALLRAAEKSAAAASSAAAAVKKKFEAKLAGLKAGLDEILAEDAKR